MADPLCYAPGVSRTHGRYSRRLWQAQARSIGSTSLENVLLWRRTKLLFFRSPRRKLAFMLSPGRNLSSNSNFLLRINHLSRYVLFQAKLLIVGYLKYEIDQGKILRNYLCA